MADAIAALHSNGAGSQRTIARTNQMAAALGTSARVELGWDQSTLTLGDSPSDVRTDLVPARPAGIGMNRVLGVDKAINQLSAGRLTLSEAMSAVERAVALPPPNIFLFAAACAVGACSLAIILGVEHWQAVVVIAISSAAGAFLRRGIARLGGSNFWQVGFAALLAGLLGAVAINLGFSSTLRLVAVCPCMILVPGPHLLNGSLDLAALRISLGFDRLVFAFLTLLSIGVGLVVGLWLGGAGLIVDPAGREISIGLDVVTAGVVAICYGVFYSAPLRILYWPFLVGAAVHAIRWVALNEWHLESYVGAGLACLVAGAVLIPVSHRFQVPFSAIGFASVVSLMPGALVFRSLSELAQLQSATGAQAISLLVASVNDANAALLTVLAMALGFIVPATIYSTVGGRRRQGARP
ncbi:threonine/serine exporter ThrE family protein [Leifsonia sp. NPDC058248]|uniref:threonine/serine ThrE exporter family protein n=1 Tax=Leifsonia sp. NPDC058248 TaxID=3346402 RepID=UPI0036DEA6BF